MEFCSNVVESDDYVAMRFSLSTLLYTQNGLNLFLLLQDKRSWRKKKMLQILFSSALFLYSCSIKSYHIVA